MNKREKEAKKQLAKKGVVVTKNGAPAGSVNLPADWESAPTATLKHGLISRLLGNPPTHQ